MSHCQLHILFLVTVQSFSIFSCKECNQSDFGIDNLVTSMCRVVLVLEEDVCYDQCVLFSKLCQTSACFILYSKVMKESESESFSVVSNSLQPHGLYSPLDSPSQNTEVGTHSLLQDIFPTQGSSRGLAHCGHILYEPEPLEKTKNNGVGSLSLLKWIFLIQESNGGLLHCRQFLYQLSNQGIPLLGHTFFFPLGHTCLLLQVSVDFLLFHSNPCDEKQIFIWCQFQKAFRSSQNQSTSGIKTPLILYISLRALGNCQ